MPLSIQSAYFTSRQSGICWLNADYIEEAPPSLYLRPDHLEAQALTLSPLKPETWGEHAAYWADDTNYYFLPPKPYRNLNLILAMELNQWADSDHPALDAFTYHAADRQAIQLKKKLFGDITEPIPFKFRRADRFWLPVPADAPNAFIDTWGNSNYLLDPLRSGKNGFEFTLASPLNRLGDTYLCTSPDRENACRIEYTPYLRSLGSKHPQGAHTEETQTHFSVFAPRANSVHLELSSELETDGITLKNPQRHALTASPDGTWTYTYPENAHLAYYYYYIDGINEDPTCDFAPHNSVGDPWAMASVSASGPSIVIDKSHFNFDWAPFQTPKLNDCVILEAHVRDLIAKLPSYDPEGSDYLQLAQWLDENPNYIKQLGINAVELQPISECESTHKAEYHWGYMPVNYFSPESTYSLSPTQASQIREFQTLVDTFHQHGIAVILDVVYNHVGHPNNLAAIDKGYYFEHTEDLELTNVSGCGNDLHSGSPMARRLICDSLAHWIEHYKIDGFRFDLAEIIGLPSLQHIEAQLHHLKPDVILIAEPWSFRGHIGEELRYSSWATWNDGYREFIRDYIQCKANQDAFTYFVGGSQPALAHSASTSINYAQSHDDYAWIDRITENPNQDGAMPTRHDIERSHLMLALLMVSLGTPMLAQGASILHSKRGVCNTYQRGDLNALDYTRISKQLTTYRYTQGWIQLRQTPTGQLLRLRKPPSAKYLAFDFVPGTCAGCVVFNADQSHPHPEQILFAINPNDEELILGPTPWIECFESTGTMLCNTHSFVTKEEGKLLSSNLLHNGTLRLAPRSCFCFVRPLG